MSNKMKSAEEYPEPTPKDLLSDDFNAIWQSIKRWDISRHNDGSYSGPTGNDVMHILIKLRPVLINAYKAGMTEASKLCNDEHTMHWNECKQAILAARDRKVGL